MEQEEGVKLKIGEESLLLFLREIEEGKLKREILKKIALRMEGSVHGTYEDKLHEKPGDCARYMC